MENSKLEFLFENMPVGYFQTSEFPASDGSYRYMPYRGPGHYYMGVKLRETGSAQCRYNTGDESVTFIVRSCPEYGVLELTGFERGSRTNA
jgi:hypothetical protein